MAGKISFSLAPASNVHAAAPSSLAAARPARLGVAADGSLVARAQPAQAPPSSVRKASGASTSASVKFSAAAAAELLPDDGHGGGDDDDDQADARSHGPLVIPLAGSSWKAESGAQSHAQLAAAGADAPPQALAGSKRDREPEPEPAPAPKRPRTAAPSGDGYGLQLVSAEEREARRRAREQQAEASRQAGAARAAGAGGELAALVDDATRSAEARAVAALSAGGRLVPSADAPLLIANAIPGTAGTASEAEKLAHDLAVRPDEADLEAYERVPISAFGEAMLRGMGWRPGEALGVTNKGLLEPIEFLPRDARLGIGATTGGGAAHVGADGRVRHHRGLDETLRKAFTGEVEVGGTVVVRRGTHAGLVARVLALAPGGACTARLAISGAEVRLALADVIAVDPNDVAGATKKIRSTLQAEAEAEAEAVRAAPAAPSGPPQHWVAPGLFVRLISKTGRLARLYNAKCAVVDVLSPGVCILQADGALIEDVPEAALETIMPKESGALVQVLVGSRKGQQARLLSKDKGAGTAEVQLVRDLAVKTYLFDDICAVALMRQ